MLLWIDTPNELIKTPSQYLPTQLPVPFNFQQSLTSTGFEATPAIKN